MSATIVVVSSSPPSFQPVLVTPSPPVRDEPVVRTSSPLPSPDALLSRKRQIIGHNFRLKSGSRAQKPPEDAIVGFESAGKLLRDELIDLGDGQPATDEATAIRDKVTTVGDKDTALADKAGTKEKAKAKSRAKSNLRTKSEPKVRQKTKPAGEFQPKLKATRKKASRQRRKSEDEACRRSASPKDNLRPAKLKGSEGLQQNYSTVDSPNCKDRTVEQTEEPASLVDSGELNLPSVPRRAGWTPAKNTRDEHDQYVRDSHTAEEEPAAIIDLTRFAYSGPVDKVMSADAISDAVSEKPSDVRILSKATNKRQLELVDDPLRSCQHGSASNKRAKTTTNTSPEKANPEPKVPKRPKTITELTTAPYREAVTTGSSGIPVTSNFFAPKLHPANAFSIDTGNVCRDSGFKIPAEPKVRKSRKKTSKAKPIEPKLVDADTFSRRIGKQDLLFGTASQLTNESPTYLKQYQQAIQASKGEAFLPSSSPLAVMNDGPQDAEMSAFADVGYEVNYKKSASGLWHAATRDIDNEIWKPSQRVKKPTAPDIDGDAEKGNTAFFKDCVQSVAPNLRFSATGNESRIHKVDEALDVVDNEPAQRATCKAADDSFMDIDDLVDRSIEQATNEAAEAVSLISVSASPTNGILQTLSKPAGVGFDSVVLAPSATMNLHNRSRSRSPLRPLDPNVTQTATKPCLGSPKRYLLSTHARYAAGDQNQQPPSLERSMPHTGTFHEETTDATVAKLPPKRPRGRPRKAAKLEAEVASKHKRKSKPKDDAKKKPATAGEPKAAILSPASLGSKKHVDEIEDSEPEISPSPPRRTAKRTVTSLELVPSQRETTEHVSVKRREFEGQHASVFARITETLKRSARTTDRARPSWHEKILLYDPIVLEDFTDWLNQQGLRYEKRRGRKQNGITKQGPAEETGEAHAQDVGDPVEAGTDKRPTVELALEPWMVQKWCESNSVCCLWREGLRGGVKATY